MMQSTEDLTAEYVMVIIGHGRRQLLWFAVTRHPTAEWLAQQIVEAFPWETAPAYLVRTMMAHMARSSGAGFGRWGSEIDQYHRDRPGRTHAEPLIGTLRRDCLDHVVIFGARHLQR